MGLGTAASPPRPPRAQLPKVTFPELVESDTGAVEATKGSTEPPAEGLHGPVHRRILPRPGLQSLA